MKALLLDRPKDWNRFRPIFLKIGFIQSILLCIGLFQMESSKVAYTINNDVDLEELTFVSPPRIPAKSKAKVVPSPPPKIKPTIPLVIETIEQSQEVEEKAEEIIVEPDEPSNFVEIDSSAFGEPTIAPIVAPILEPETDEVLDRAERMPIFGDCTMLEESEMRQCSDKQLLSFIYNELKYPSLAKEIGVTGMVVIQFIVGKDGEVRDVNILRGIGGGCDKESKRVIKKLPSWMPGKQNGRPVSVRYTIPIKFELK